MTPAASPGQTNTPTETLSPTDSPTRTVTSTSTPIPTWTRTPTMTGTPTGTFTFTPNPSFTPPCDPFGQFGSTSFLGVSGGVSMGIQIRGSRFTLSEPATVLSISLLQTNVSGDSRAILAVYGDDGGSIRDKLGETGPVTLHVGWNTELLDPPVELNPGEYWLAYMYNAPTGMWARVYGSGGVNTTVYSTDAGFTWGALPPVLGGGFAYRDGVEPIYAAYCTAPEPFPTPTQTPTATETPSPTATDTFTVTGTWSPVDTDTLTETPTETLSATETLSPTVTDSPTVTGTPTSTFSATFTLPPSTSSPTATTTPTTGIIDMTFAEYMNAYSAGIAGAGSGDFRMLDDPVIALLFENMTDALLAGTPGAAQPILLVLDALGVHYRLVSITDLSEGPVYGFVETALPGDADFTGWGAVLFRTSATGYRVWSAPHPQADLYTEDIAAEGFESDPGGAVLLLAGAHRDALGDLNANGFSDSDAAHETGNLFHLLTTHLASKGLDAGAPYWFIQIHGSADLSTEPDIVGSSGADAPVLTGTSALVRVDDEVDTRGNALMGVWGWWEGTGDDQDGDYLLRATTNVQGDVLEAMGMRDSFMHFEIERTARDSYHAGAGAGYDGVLDLLAALRQELGTVAFPTPFPTVTPTPSPTMTPTFTGSWTPFPTDTASPTATSTGTATSTSTASPTASPTATGTDTPTPTPTDTLSMTATVSPTPSLTPSWTMTSSSTATSSPSTPASSTPTPLLEMAVHVWPNPLTEGDSVQIRLEPEVGEAVEAVLYTVAYRRVVRFDLALTPGARTWVLTLRDASDKPLANGLYYLLLRTDTGEHVLKILILR